MMNKRRSGVLLPVASLPGSYGIGTFSKEAYDFIDFLENAGQKLWQILPLGPTGYGDSPYQSFSTFAGNPYYIDLTELIQDGYLTKAECDACDFGDTEAYIDYEKIYEYRFILLKKAFQNWQEKNDPVERQEYENFVTENAFWLSDYALFMAVKDAHEGICWIDWEEDIKTRQKEAMQNYQKELQPEIACYQFMQYLFVKQWRRLKAYANKKGIKIIGDIPIYVALDSADSWANPELFQLNPDCTPKAVAGCPPDAFSATGQLWGNPLYRWEYHKETGYAWWMQRIDFCFVLYDIVRIDHFRGFEAYYSIPYGDPTAEYGHWEKGPGYDLFKTMKETLGKKEVIAEDLGFLTPDVIKMLKQCGYPGMKVLQFAFDSAGDSTYLPHHYTNNCVVYTGTHDNDTTASWYETLSVADRRFAKNYLNIKGRKDAHLDVVRAALASVADTAVIPIQDYLGLGNESRINQPSTLGINWKWRLQEGQYTDELAAMMKEMNWIYGR